MDHTTVAAAKVRKVPILIAQPACPDLRQPVCEALAATACVVARDRTHRVLTSLDHDVGGYSMSSPTPPIGHFRTWRTKAVVSRTSDLEGKSRPRSRARPVGISVALCGHTHKCLVNDLAALIAPSQRSWRPHRAFWCPREHKSAVAPSELKHLPNLECFARCGRHGEARMGLFSRKVETTTVRVQPDRLSRSVEAGRVPPPTPGTTYRTTPAMTRRVTPPSAAKAPKNPALDRSAQ